MQLKLILPLLFLVLTPFLFKNSHAKADAPDVAAWIESATPGDALTPSDAQSKPKIVVLRQGKPLAINKSVIMTELRSGDRILINDDHAYLNLIISTGPLRVTTADIANKDRGYEIKTHPNSVWSNLVALVKDKIKPGEIQAVTAATKGKGDGYPSLPADRTEAPKMAAGERALHFRWLDGEPPYRLSLVRDDQVISEVNVAKDHEATLPKQSLPPGTYKLVLKDKKGLVPDVHPLYGNAIVTENLMLVAPADVPPMPSALTDSPLPEETRQLLYADWLARQGNGEWTLEAIQHVFLYAKEYKPAAEWLRQWGGE
jgi:hypothetical protein